MLNLLPIEQDLQYTLLTSRSFRVRLQIINDTIDFLLNHRRRQNHHQRQQQEEQRQEEQQMEHQQERQQESTPAAD